MPLLYTLIFHDYEPTPQFRGQFFLVWNFASCVVIAYDVMLAARQKVVGMMHIMTLVHLVVIDGQPLAPASKQSRLLAH